MRGDVIEIVIAEFPFQSCGLHNPDQIGSSCVGVPARGIRNDNEHSQTQRLGLRVFIRAALRGRKGICQYCGCCH